MIDFDRDLLTIMCWWKLPGLDLDSICQATSMKLNSGT